jgi:hypothetical protein
MVIVVAGDAEKLKPAVETIAPLNCISPLTDNP